MNDDVIIFEVGPRDGLQNEKQHIETKDKIKLVNMLSACGFKKIEVTSFVSPKWVPQMADAQEVMDGIIRYPNISYTALTPNIKGFERSQWAKVDEVAIFASASEGFSQKNINCSIAEGLERFQVVLEKAKSSSTPVRGYISCITDCPYDGAVRPEQVADVAKKLFEMGCYEISLGDTIGSGTPEKIAKMLDAVIEQVPAKNLAGHFHDTNGRALDNILISLEKGLRCFDSAVGGLGGCPYAPGAKGNVATEAVVKMLAARGYSTGINIDELEKVAIFAKSLRKSS